MPAIARAALDLQITAALSAEAHTEAQRRGVPLSHIVAEWVALGRNPHD